MKIKALLFFVCFAGCGVAEPVQNIAKTAVTQPDKTADVADAEALGRRRDKCAEENGLWAESVIASTCALGSLEIVVDGNSTIERCDGGEGAQYDHQCVHFDGAGRVYFNDGPSSPVAGQIASAILGNEFSNWRWTDIFWPAARNHDYCYHHNPITYGYTHEDCDQQFYDDLSALCAVQTEDVDGCRANAATSYIGVRKGGEQYYNTMNSYAEYGGYKPLWEALNLSGPVVDDAFKSRVESLMSMSLF